ncbi:MAG: hypothetical protein ABL958_13000 [Bdellovibrionia bacterium]
MKWLKRPRFYFPAIYATLAGYCWISFTQTNHDGLANVVILLVVLPFTIVDRILNRVIYSEMGDFILARLAHGAGLPRGYLANHAYHFFPCMAAMVVIMYFVGRMVEKEDRAV